METTLIILGGLGLFLYAISHMSDVLKELLGEKAKRLISKFTRNVFTALLTGIAITLILDSSSAVIIMAIMLVKAKALTFRQAIGIVLGANIGTTFSSQIIAFDIGKFSPIPIFLGMLLIFFSTARWITLTGRAIIYFGILFFGLYTMERGVEPFKDLPQFHNWMLKMENQYVGAGAGALTTLIIQSSSATVGMVITLAKKGLITLSAGIAVMLGAELGTCADTLLATIKSSRQAMKTGFFHLFFNLFTILIALAVFPFFVKLVLFISGHAHLEQQIANAHMLFNTLGVLLFIPFISSAEKFMNWLLPEKETELPDETIAATV